MSPPNESTEDAQGKEPQQPQVPSAASGERAHAGHPRRSSVERTLLVVIAGIAIVTLVELGAVLVREQDNEGPSEAATRQELHLVIPGTLGCSEPEELTRLTGYAKEGELTMYSAALARDIGSGTCALFGNGGYVYVTDRRASSGLVKFRQAGTATTEFWTYANAVR